MSKQRTSAEVFVRTYNESSSIAEVAAKLGCTANNVHQRRHQLAQKGVKFKAFDSQRGGARLDIEALQAVAEATLPKGSELFVPQTRQTAEPTA